MPIARHPGLRGRLILLPLAAFAVLFAMIVQHTLAHRAERFRNATAQLLHNAQLIAARQQQIAAQADAILNGLVMHPELHASASAEECAQALAAWIKPEVARPVARS